METSSVMKKRDTSPHLMRPSLNLLEHRARFRSRGWFSERLPIDPHGSVSADNKRITIRVSNGFSFNHRQWLEPLPLLSAFHHTLKQRY
jgi:hypothetical protein